MPLTDDRGHREKLELPTGLGLPELDAKATELHNLWDALLAEQATLRELHAERTRAEQDDLAAYAAALRKGANEPARERAAEVESKIEQAQRRVQALDLAAGAVEDEIVELVERNRGAWVAKLDKRTADQRESFQRAVAELDDLSERLDILAALHGWLERFPQPNKNRFSYKRRGVQLLEQLATTGPSEAGDPPDADPAAKHRRRPAGRGDGEGAGRIVSDEQPTNAAMNQLIRESVAIPRAEKWANETVARIAAALPDRALLEPFLDAVERIQWVRPEALADVARLFPWDGVSDQNDPKQIQRALRAFLEKRPHLVAVEPIGAGARRSRPLDMNQMIRQAAGR